MVEDLAATGARVVPPAAGAAGAAGALAPAVVAWEEFLRIDEHERFQGALVGKPWEKLVHVGEMLAVAKGGGGLS